MSNRITDHEDAEGVIPAEQDLHMLSSGDFAMLGIQDFAYVRKIENPEENDAARIYAVFTADGTHIASFESYAVAYAAIRQHDMEPRSVH